MTKLNNLLTNKKIKSFFIIFLLFFIYTFICAFSYVNAVSNNISKNVLRLHVIANSDTEADQNLKYKVRDEILKYMNSICVNCKTKDEAIQILNDNKEKFEEIALNTIIKEGYNYDVTQKIGNFYFPTKTYGDIVFPAGNYDALRIEIGEAKGKNWWCVMFPSLCFVDISNGIVPDNSKEELKTTLTEEEYSIISSNKNIDIKIKFKLLELLSSKNLFTAKNK